MGGGANVNAVFGIATMVIAIPTGVKVFNWLFTMYRGKINFSTPMLWGIAFLITFTLGGMTGVMLSIPAADFQFHNSLFLVAHFHNVIVGGVVFGYLAGLVYWFPKFFGFKLNEFWGKVSVYAWLIGFFVAFTPIYILGMMGATRRVSSYTNADWQLYYGIAAFGTLIIAFGILAFVLQIVVPLFNRKKYAVGGDPWNARNLEWSGSSPLPIYNFAVTKNLGGIDSFWYDKEAGRAKQDTDYEDIHMPRNTALPIIISGFAFVMGFALIFHINWLAILAVVGIIISLIVRSFDYNLDYYITKEEVKEIESKLNR
jgi:cytochrome o ubiquinol oxidase subunit 1